MNKFKNKLAVFILVCITTFIGLVSFAEDKNIPTSISTKVPDAEFNKTYNDYVKNKIAFNGQVLDNKPTQEQFKPPVHDTTRISEAYESESNKSLTIDGIMYELVGMNKQENGTYKLYYKQK